MPMVRPSPGPPPPTGPSTGPPSGLLEPPSHARVARTESLKSERSDKRVSFNKDVGVKHIPRGAKPQPRANNTVTFLPRPQPRSDEWAHCEQVHLEPVVLDSEQLEQEAQDLVRLLDHVNCDASANPFTRSLDRPRKNNKNNNEIANNVRDKNTNVIRNRSLNRTTNPIQRTSNPIPRSLSHRHRSVDNLPDSDIDSPPLSRSGYKSVPDLNTVYYDNKEARGYQYRDVVDPRHNGAPLNSGYKSVDNLSRGVTHQPAHTRNALASYKSLGELPCTTASDTDTMDQRPFKPKVGNIIKRFNAEAEEVRRNSLEAEVEVEVPRGPVEPDRFRCHNNNQPFSYTGLPLASVQAVRRLSPTRELTRPSPPRDMSPPPLRDSPPRDVPVYAQVNKRDTRLQTNGVSREDNYRSSRLDDHNYRNSRLDDHNYRNTRQDDYRSKREYSAKIIITDNDHNGYNDYKDDHKSPYTEDDDAYESYQVPEDNLRRLIREDMEYKDANEYLNNNINMSSVGVQTDALPKAPSRSRKHKSPGDSPQRKQQTKTELSKHNATKDNVYRQDNARLDTLSRSRENILTRSQDNSLSRSRENVISRSQENSLSRSRENVLSHSRENLHRSRENLLSRGGRQEQKQLHSATLVRQVNHGFGRTDRSPSPPMRRPQARQVRKNVVPLLSDTSDSEAEHRRRAVDPLARIRDQVLQREKLQEEEEEQEEGRRGARMEVYRSHDDMTPLTIDEVDALSLVMEQDTGRKSLVVSNHAAASSQVTRNHRSRRTETVTHHRDSLPRPTKPPRDKPAREPARTPSRTPSRGHREPTPTRGHREATPTRGHRETTPTRGHRETTPTRGHRETTPTRNHRETTPTRGHRETTPTRPHREATPTRGPTPTRPTKGARKDPTTLERNKKNNLEKERKEKASKEKKEGEEKKKKKRIKIKFFYDPRPQDDPNEDPLAKFTEFRGTSSDERASPRDTKNHTLSKSRERLDKSRERLDKSRERLDKSHERLDKSHERLDKSRERLDKSGLNRSRDRLDRSRDRLDRSRDDSRHREMSVDVRPNNDSYDDHSPERPRHDSDDDERGSPDGRPGRSLSDKYKSGTLYDPTEEHNDQPPATTEGEEKEAKMLRQRNKFFSALMSDGRAKGEVKKKKSPAPQPPPDKAKQQGPLWFSRDREEGGGGEAWESSTLSRAELRARRDQRQESGFATVQRGATTRKYSGESTASSGVAPPQQQKQQQQRVARTTSFKQRYFGDTDLESHGGGGGGGGVADYRSLPNRSALRNGPKPRRGVGGRGVSPGGVTGSAGSSLQSSESEVDSHGGSHASRASRASRVSTASNRSVYLHATAVADIPVRRPSEDAPSERGVNRQSRKVSRSFSLLAPWKPRHFRDKYELDYDNRDAHHKGALPPRPPRRPNDDKPPRNDKNARNDKTRADKVARSHSVYKDSRLAGWLRRKRNKEAKGI